MVLRNVVVPIHTIILTDRAKPAFIPGEYYGTGRCTSLGCRRGMALHPRGAADPSRPKAAGVLVRTTDKVPSGWGEVDHADACARAQQNLS